MKSCANGCVSWHRNAGGSAIASRPDAQAPGIKLNCKKLYRLYNEERLTCVNVVAASGLSEHGHR